MSAADTAELLDTARAAARAAAELLGSARPSAIRTKGNPRDLVTEWDLRSEELIRKVLEERAPGIPVLGEEAGEGAGALHRKGLRWIVDPIDGTVNFAHGLPIWSISIGLEDAGALQVGVVAAPALGWWFEASLGGGARDGTGAPLAVSKIERLDQAMLTTGFPYDRATHPENNFARWEHMQRRAGACRRLGSASLDLCIVANGWLDGYWERRLKSWDIAAGVLIVAEAGGTVTNTQGGPFDVHAGEVLASNGAIHQELIAELRTVKA
ncbi:MAG: inositol monophosphatase [Deltaproteobacteria bacterium]|nr:inositol monophosphatase [Deltaproteobacteria bacterium]